MDHYGGDHGGWKYQIVDIDVDGSAGNGLEGFKPFQNEVLATGNAQSQQLFWLDMHEGAS